MENIQIVIFKINNDLFGVDIKEVREIIKPLDTTSLPETPKWLEGIIKLRQRVIPIINLRRYFGISENSIELKNTIVVEIKENLVGLNVDSVEGIIQIMADDIDKSPDVIAKEYIKGIAKNGEQLIILLNLDYLLSTKEVEKLETVVKKIKQEEA